MSLNDELSKSMSNVRYCYAKYGGSGFVNKDECVCDNGYKCESYRDQERFHQRFNEEGDLNNRTETIQKIKPEFRNSKWWENNVIE